jgi:P4 family phage/plasmid primase-like protien
MMVVVEPFINEPKQPQPEDFKDPANYEFALTEYKQKLELYQARLQFHKDASETPTEEELKDIFYCVNKIKDYPKYEDFCPVNAEEKALGYGGAAKKESFKPALVSEWIATHEKLHFKTDIETGIVYFYNGKSWVQNAEPYLEYIVEKILKDENRQSHYNNILHVLRGCTYTQIEFSKKIACENGLLDAETQTLTDFNEKEMPFHQIPVKFDKEAKCPNWEAFITQVVNQDDLATIQEWSGFLLLPDYRFHKLLWIHGVGRNGKGVWQRTMETILGNRNISGVGLEEFDGNHRFALKQLYGKLFNPCSEPTTNKELQTPLLKKATGQDTIEAEMKGKQARVPFRNYAKITVLANKFPKVKDQTVAFRERRLFIKFPNEFTGKNQIQNVEDNWIKINDERSGILNWMLAGLKRLLEQGYFTESKTQQETEAEFLRASDTISSFLTEMCLFDKTKVTARSDALEAYKNYCEVLGLDTENEKKFTQTLKDTPRISSCVVRNPKMERAWKGIGLNNIDDDGNIIKAVTPVTLVTCFLPTTIFQESSIIEGSTKPVTDVTSVTESEAYKNRLCSNECENFDKPSCPFFVHKITKKHPLPLKCYGFKAPNPGENM